MTEQELRAIRGVPTLTQDESQLLEIQLLRRIQDPPSWDNPRCVVRDLRATLEYHHQKREEQYCEIVRLRKRAESAERRFAWATAAAGVFAMAFGIAVVLR